MESAHLINNAVDDKTSDHFFKPFAAYHRNAAVISVLTLLLIAAVTFVSTADKSPSQSLSIQPKPKSDPELVFTMSLYISYTELKDISSLPEALIAESNDPRTVSALRDCEILFDDGVSQLNNSINSVTVDRVFSSRKIRALNSWISAAMTDVETCLDGLQEMGSTVVDEVSLKVQLSKQCMSNTLAILAKIKPSSNIWS